MISLARLSYVPAPKIRNVYLRTRARAVSVVWRTYNDGFFVYRKRTSALCRNTSLFAGLLLQKLFVEATVFENIPSQKRPGAVVFRSVAVCVTMSLLSVGCVDAEIGELPSVRRLTESVHRRSRPARPAVADVPSLVRLTCVMPSSLAFDFPWYANRLASLNTTIR